jgi:hypothetical protein
VKLNKSSSPSSHVKNSQNISSFNKNNTISYIRQPDFEGIETTGQEYWTTSRNQEVNFDKKKLFSILLENKASKRCDLNTINF